ncbi:MAG TPA: IS1595 family transposase [Candidatus Saccharimonadales bacterium]|nr:IS1595 family transposase [Candidatus Saccharimonadales bacterium]
MREIQDKANLEKSEVVEQIPLACADERLAVEFLEEKIWQGTPVCPHCNSESVIKFMDAKTGQRNKRFLWKCHACKKQFTIRVGTVMEESRIPLRHWVFAMWRSATSKKGAAALEIKRQCQISYPSALFMMHRIRLAMTDGPESGLKLDGIVECDETYVGGKPRPGTGYHKRGRGTDKQPVFGMVERGGNIHRRVVADVSGKTLKSAIRECVNPSATIMSDEWPSYRGIGKDFAGGHRFVNHGLKQYVRGNVSTNTAESSFAILKRGIVGIYHSVSKKHLHRYVNEFDFRWNARKMNDGDRTVALMQGALGKRLDYKTLTR